MKIQDTKHLFDPFDAATGLAHFLISLGQFEPYKAPAPVKLNASTEWTAMPSARNNSGTNMPPYICGKCACSRSTSHFEGTDPRSAEFRHASACNGGIENPPREISDAYLSMRKDFYRHNAPRSPAGIDLLAERRRNPEFFLVGGVDNG
jgi:hypothetical protein